MFLRSEQGRKLRLQKQKLPVCLVGISPTAFIANLGWLVNMLHFFDLRYLVTSSLAKVPEIEDEYPDAKVSADYKQSIVDALAEYGNKLVVAICLRTADHAACMKFAIEAGVKCIMTDKPPVENLAEWHEINELAKLHGCKILVSYQHECNAPTDAMAELTAKHIASFGASTVTAKGFFIQKWMTEGPDNWRIRTQFGGLKDIASHAARGACRVVGSRISKVTSSSHGKGRKGNLEAPNLDHGNMEVVFANGVQGEVGYTQVDKAGMDDIGWLVELVNPNTGSVQKLLWRLEWGSGEVLYVGHKGSKLDEIETWEPHFRADSPLFSAEVNGLYPKSPTAHMQGWSDMWFYFFSRAWRIFLAHAGETELAEHLIPMCYGHCPDFENAGLDSTVFVDMAIESFESGKAVTAAEVCAKHTGLSPESQPFVLSIPPGARDTVQTTVV